MFTLNVVYIALVNVLVILCEINDFSNTYRKTLDCSGHTACAFDQPFQALVGIKDLIRCAVRCSRERFCVNFNFLEKEYTCQLFDTYPFMIAAKKSCRNYEIYPRKLALLERTGNIALRQRTCQSSTYWNHTTWLAVDGIALYDVTYCSHTNVSDFGNNWFMVDLQDHFVIDYVRILARDGDNNITIRYKNLTIDVTNSSWLEKTPEKNIHPLCGVYLGPPVKAVWFQVNCSLSIPPSRYVIVYQTRVNTIDGGYLSLCEFEVYGK